MNEKKKTRDLRKIREIFISGDQQVGDTLNYDQV